MIANLRYKPRDVPNGQDLEDAVPYSVDWRFMRFFSPLVMRWYRASTSTTEPEQICADHRSREDMCPESLFSCTLSGPHRLSSLHFFSLAEQGGEEIRKRNQRRVSAFLLRESLHPFFSEERMCPSGTSEWERGRRLREGEDARRDRSGEHLEGLCVIDLFRQRLRVATFPIGEGIGLCVSFDFPITANSRYQPLAADDRPYGVDWRV